MALGLFCIDAFSSREPGPTSLENALAQRHEQRTSVDGRGGQFVSAAESFAGRRRGLARSLPDAVVGVAGQKQHAGVAVRRGVLGAEQSEDVRIEPTFEAR